MSSCLSPLNAFKFNDVESCDTIIYLTMADINKILMQYMHIYTQLHIYNRDRVKGVMTATVGNTVRHFMDFQIFCRPAHISFVNLLEFAQLSIGYNR